MTTSYHEENRESLRRVRELVARLDDEAMSQRLEDGWTVGEVLAHMAQWDQISLARWLAFDREGAFVSLTTEIADVINTASIPVWRVLTPSAIRDLVLQAAEAADDRTANLSPEALAYVEETGRTFILDRASHRSEHLDQIERILTVEGRFVNRDILDGTADHPDDAASAIG